MKKQLALVLCLVLIGSLIAGCGSPKAEENVIKIGTVFELTGGNSALGKATLDGIKLAVKEANENGGINGKKIVLINEDNKSEPAEGANATKKLVERDRVVAILGSVASSAVLASAPITQAAEIPWVAATATNPKVTEVGDYVFRVCFIDPFQGAVVAKFASQNLQAKKAAVLVDMTSDYSKGLTQFFKDNFTKAGGQIVAEEAYSQKDTDFNAQLTKIKGMNPDVIFIPGYYSEVGLIAKQARQLGLTQPLLGGDAWDSPKLYEIAGDAINGCYFSNHYTSQDNSPNIVAFVKKYEAEYGRTPDAFGALGYESAAVLLNAIKQAGSTEGKAIRDALAATKEFPTVTGKLTLNEKRDAVKAAVILQLQKDRQVFVERIEP